MVNFGEENMKETCMEYLLAACRRGYNAVPHLAKMVHFDPDHPERHNAFVPDTKNKYASVYENDKFIYRDKQGVLDQLYEDKKNFILENIGLVYDKLTPHEKKTHKRWINSDKNKHKSKEEQERIDFIREELNLLLFNNKDVPIETKEKCKQQKKLALSQ
jgi:hypothetical protein